MAIPLFPDSRAERPLFGLSPKELRFGLAMLAMAFLAWALPAIAQPQDYHRFADARAFFGVPHAQDVLSNLGFLAAGLWGLRAISRRKGELSPALAWSLEIFFWGVLLTGAGSSYYHWAPQDSRLVWDRLPMTIAFAGACGALAAVRVSERAGAFALCAALAYGLGSVAYWGATGNLSPYAVMQFGGMSWIAAACFWGRRQRVDLPWGWLLGLYVGAKACELLDGPIFALTQGALSGHTVKHVLSALAAASFAWAISRGFGRGAELSRPTQLSSS